MKPAPFAYHRPERLDEAVDLAGRLENARALAGGGSLMPMLNMRYARPDHLIDLGHVEGLRALSLSPAGVRIAAMCRQRDLARSHALAAAAPVFRKALRWVGHIQTRNQGTLGGSLCNLDPAAELPAVCTALDATFTVASRSGRRALPASRWARTYMTPDVRPDELLVEVAFTPWTGRQAAGFCEISRRHGDFAMAGAIALLSAADGRITRASLVSFGVGPTPIRHTALETSLLGAPADAGLAARADEVGDLPDVLEDALVSAAYRRRLARVTLRRALADALGDLSGAALHA